MRTDRSYVEVFRFVSESVRYCGINDAHESAQGASLYWSVVQVTSHVGVSEPRARAGVNGAAGRDALVATLSKQD